jgi:protein SCO1/2
MKSLPEAIDHRRRMIAKWGLIACGAGFLARDAHAIEHVDIHPRHSQDRLASLLAAGVRRSEARYELPKLAMVKHDRMLASFPEELDDGWPLILDFIYTSCPNICPMSSKILSKAHELLGPEGNKVRIVSITIDPLIDTPDRLAQYARKFNASAQWELYTGTPENSVALQKAFHTYRGDKSNHLPVTFMRGMPGENWVRLEGLASPDVLVSEFRRLNKLPA